MKPSERLKEIEKKYMNQTMMPETHFLINRVKVLEKALEVVQLAEKSFMRVLKGLDQGISTVPNSGAHKDLEFDKKYWNETRKALAGEK